VQENALADDQKAMLLQVLQLTEDQINALPAEQREAILKLKNQFNLGVVTT